MNLNSTTYLALKLTNEDAWQDTHWPLYTKQPYVQSPCEIHETCTSGQFQRTNEQVSLNVVAENNGHFNNTPPFIHGSALACHASGLYDMQVSNTAKEGNISKLENDKSET